jgi:magnesium-transporting ATPase (P-type)
MLTGDKMETAEQIAHSCAMFETTTQIFRINESRAEEEELIKHLQYIKDKLFSTKPFEEISKGTPNQKVRKFLDDSTDRQMEFDSSNSSNMHDLSNFNEN